MGQIRNIPELISGPLRAEIKEIAKEAFREVLESITRNGTQGEKPSETAKPYVDVKEAGKVSGLGWGLGYLGGLIALLLAAPLVINGTNTETYIYAFPLTAVFFLIFA